MHVDHRSGSGSQLPGLGVHRGFIMGQEISTDQPLLPESGFHVKKTEKIKWKPQNTLSSCCQPSSSGQVFKLATTRIKD